MPTLPSREAILGSERTVEGTRTRGEGAAGRLPLTEDMLLNEPSGNLFGLTQATAMGWNPEEVGREQYVIVSTHGGLRGEDGSPIALGYHTGHWEVNLLVREAAITFKDNGAMPFAVYVTDPCDGCLLYTSPSPRD